MSPTSPLHRLGNTERAGLEAAASGWTVSLPRELFK